MEPEIPISPAAGSQSGEAPGLFALIRSDFRRQAALIGWKRVPVSEGFWFITSFRIRQRIYRIGNGMARGLLLALVYLPYRVIKAINRSGIGSTARIGPGLAMAHFGGVWIDHDVEIGSDCTIFHQVTITKGGKRPVEHRGPAPVIGNRVRIMPGAKILGPVRIEDDALIGTNAVVLEDVPRGAIAAGNPAKIVGVKEGFENAR